MVENILLTLPGFLRGPGVLNTGKFLQHEDDQHVPLVSIVHSSRGDFHFPQQPGRQVVPSVATLEHCDHGRCDVKNDLILPHIKFYCGVNVL